MSLASWHFAVTARVAVPELSPALVRQRRDPEPVLRPLLRLFGEALEFGSDLRKLIRDSKLGGYAGKRETLGHFIVVYVVVQPR